MAHCRIAIINAQLVLQQHNLIGHNGSDHGQNNASFEREYIAGRQGYRIEAQLIVVPFQLKQTKNSHGI
jgi:hypothetical protein